MVNSCKFVNI